MDSTAPFSIQRLIDVLNESGLDSAYDHFVSSPALPYVLFRRDTSENMYADNRVYKKINRWNIILCTEKKETKTERALEAILDENGICWEITDEMFVKSERLYQIIYEFSEMEE